ncbi:hypothetical protein FNF27_01211 [Cafeteria roenbergensis]|uniref:Maleylacetoacetate isomerase n=1 Tax=Cafeteria roenbergensis TaxID=33653 RepID=A0A5A8EHL5_CAFRO|nr:hypothetical protein FNF27_01211 [Cafeteria roenbergensis]
MAAVAVASPAKRAREDEAPAAAADAAKPVLYSYWRSTCSWRVRIALALKGIDYEYKAVHLLKDGGEQLKDEFAALNPMREVPALVIDGNTLTQSMSIIEYLEDTRPTAGVKLLPGSAAERAKVRAMAQMIGCDIQPVQNLRVLKRFMAEFSTQEEKDAKKLEWGKWVIETGFRGLEAALSTTAGKYACGDEVTLVDVLLVPQEYNAGRFGVDMSAFPTIARVCAAAKELPAFKAADPSEMPDKF